jgi:hypothetical protein
MIKLDQIINQIHQSNPSIKSINQIHQSNPSIKSTNRAHRSNPIDRVQSKSAARGPCFGTFRPPPYLIATRHQIVKSKDSLHLKIQSNFYKRSQANGQIKEQAQAA